MHFSRLFIIIRKSATLFIKDSQNRLGYGWMGRRKDGGEEVGVMQFFGDVLGMGFGMMLIYFLGGSG